MPSDNEPSVPRPTSTSTTDALPVAPSLGPTLDAVSLPRHTEDADRRRIAIISVIAVMIAVLAVGAAEVLVALIALITNLAFYHRVSLTPVDPAGSPLGTAIAVLPLLGGIVIGVMARYGSAAIRGHGIPEAMERILYAGSRIPLRVTFLKPISAAISIGTGGPFGAEGPIIATGGALGSVVGQTLRITADERKVLLAAGAAAGMTAIFGTPVSAVLLAIELLVFEYRARSLVPIALASAAAAGIRIALHGPQPVFPMADLAQPGGGALAGYIVLGALVGLASVYVTRGVYAIEDAFERLPIHWMWWPALGGAVVGLVGLIEPRVLGVGYTNIEGILGGELVGRALITLVVFKLVAWAIALGSGTSGGTLAPLFTIGGGLGALLGRGAALLLPALRIDPRLAGLVGMAAMFAGASRALLASVVFAFETTRQPIGLLPLLGGCSAAYLISLATMRHTIMTERLARRGAPVRTEYSVDFLDQVLVRDAASRDVVTLDADRPLGEVRAWLASGATNAAHNGFPVMRDDRLVGVVTRRDLADASAGDDQPVHTLVRRRPAVIFDDHTLRQAADHMVRERVGRLPVVQRRRTHALVGIITRSDLLDAHQHRLDAAGRAERSLTLRGLRRRGSQRAS